MIRISSGSGCSPNRRCKGKKTGSSEYDTQKQIDGRFHVYYQNRTIAGIYATLLIIADGNTARKVTLLQVNFTTTVNVIRPLIVKLLASKDNLTVRIIFGNIA